MAFRKPSTGQWGLLSLAGNFSASNVYSLFDERSSHWARASVVWVCWTRRAAGSGGGGPARSTWLAPSRPSGTCWTEAAHLEEFQEPEVGDSPISYPYFCLVCWFLRKFVSETWLYRGVGTVCCLDTCTPCIWIRARPLARPPP